MKMKKRKFVLVEWVDSCAKVKREWVNPEEAARWAKGKPATCRTVGFIIRESKKRLIVAQSDTIHGQLDGLFEIPKGCIRKVRQLRRL